MRIFRTLFLICTVLLFGTLIYRKSGLRPSGMTVDGRPVSESEANASLREVGDAAKHFDLKTGAYSGPTEWTTPIGRIVQDMIAKGRSTEEWRRQALKGLSFDATIASSALRTKTSIGRSLQDLQTIEAVDADYFHRREALIDEYGSRLGNLPSLQEKILENQSLLRELASSNRAVFEAAREYLRFALHHEHQVDPDKNLVYWNEPDLPRVKRLRAAISDTIAENVKQVAEAGSRMKKAQQELREAADPT